MLVWKRPLSTPDFHQEKLASVHRRLALYTSAFQARAIRERQEEDVLEWICPKDLKYLTPKGGKEFRTTCEWFLKSSEYSSWAGQGDSTLICTGQGTSYNIRL